MPMSETDNAGFLPNFCAIRSAFVVVVSAELLAIVLTLAAAPGPGEFWPMLSLRSLYVQWIALAAAALFCLLRRPLARLSSAQSGLLAWCLVLLVTGGLFFAADYLDVRGKSELLPALARHLLIAGIVGAVSLRYLYEQHRERLREAAESRARLQALQARIRPHFLFNSMNTIASLTRSDPRLAEQVVQDFSDLFRASLTDAAALSTLGEELDLAQGYLRIERQRLGERLRLDWQVDGEVPLQAPLPALVLQPLLENAVYHGIEPATDGGDIGLRAVAGDEGVTLTIWNSLPATGGDAHREGNRIALDNVRERLEAVFAGRADMLAGRAASGYRVEIRLPVAPP
jgi:two-component system sensor histidine kinase AlgZ